MAACAWIRSLGWIGVIQCEARVCYGKADLFIPELRIAVECGRCAPRKAFSVLEGRLNGLYVMPYLGQLTCKRQRCFPIYYFTATDHGVEVAKGIRDAESLIAADAWWRITAEVYGA
jgi:hypothetical protein